MSGSAERVRETDPLERWVPRPDSTPTSGEWLEWLAQQMDQAGIAYARHDNCFPWIEDWPRAQQLMDQQLRVDWPTLLTGMAGTLNPIHDQLFQAYPARYYWSTYQSEWAIDLTF